MKQVVIGMKNGQPYVIRSSKNIEVVFKEEKKKSLKKQIKTLIYNIKAKVK